MVVLLLAQRTMKPQHRYAVICAFVMLTCRASALLSQLATLRPPVYQQHDGRSALFFQGMRRTTCPPYSGGAAGAIGSLFRAIAPPFSLHPRGRLATLAVMRFRLAAPRWRRSAATRRFTVRWKALAIAPLLHRCKTWFSHATCPPLSVSTSTARIAAARLCYALAPGRAASATARQCPA